MEEYLFEFEEILEESEFDYDPDPLSSYHLIGPSKESKNKNQKKKRNSEEVVKYEIFDTYAGIKRFLLPYKGMNIIFKIKSRKELVRLIRTACKFCMQKDNDLLVKNFNMRFYKGDKVCPLYIKIDDFLDFDDCFIELDTKMYSLKQVDDVYRS